MFFKALLTRQYSMSDETVQIIIPNTEIFGEFKERIFSALKIMDYRANIQMNRLFEDTELTDSLDYHELQVTKKATSILYPLEKYSNSLDLGQGTTDFDTTYGPAFEFSKIMAGGESIRLFLHRVESYEEINTAVASIWKLLDSRLKVTNNRELKCRDYLMSVEMSTRLKVVKVLDILYGRAFKDKVIEELKGAKLNQTMEAMRQENVSRS